MKTFEVLGFHLSDHLILFIAAHFIKLVIREEGNVEFRRQVLEGVGARGGQRKNGFVSEVQDSTEQNDENQRQELDKHVFRGRWGVVGVTFEVRMSRRSESSPSSVNSRVHAHEQVEKEILSVEEISSFVEGLMRGGGSRSVS